MTKERILLMIEQLLKIYNEIDNEIDDKKESEGDWEIELNNLVEFVWEDENGNWLYRFRD